MSSAKSCKQSTTVKSNVKPITVNAYQPGAQNAQQSAHISQQEAIQHQMNMNNQHGGTTCPQASMMGMSSTPHDANQVSCTTNQNHWQARTNAVNDSSVGCVIGGGSRKKRSKSKRKSRRVNKRKHKKSTRKHKRSHRRKNKKNTRSRRKRR